MSGSVGSITLTNGALDIQGSSTSASNLTVSLIKNNTEIDASANGGRALIVAKSAVKSIEITGGSGNDTIYIDSGITVPATISGGAGNDQIRSGSGFTTITDGAGNDWISGRGTSNVITVGSGNDTVLGASGPDTITVGSGNDSINGAGGNDSITAGNGDDSITGGSGNVYINAGNGDDSIAAGHGNDQIAVGSGLSKVYAGTGTNKITLGNTYDTIAEYGGKDSISYSQPTTSGSSSSSSTTTSTSTTSTSAGSTSTGSTTTGNSSVTATSPATSVSSPTNGNYIGTTSWSTYTSSTTSNGVKAVMQVLAPAPMVGIGIVVRALNSTLGAGTPINSNYQWNFGDPSGAYNTLQGFNAAHIYNTPGTYPITLTVTNYLHQTSTVTMDITISADTRRAIYVNSSTGNDGNNGSSPTQAVKSTARADQLVNNNTEVLFARGEEFNSNAAIKLNYKNVFVGAYGTGADPIINDTLLGTGTVVFTTNSHSAAGVTISDVKITTLNDAGPYTSSAPMGVMAGGYDTSVVGVTFGYVEYAVNGSPAPEGLTVQNCSLPKSGDLQGYFVWDQGTDSTVLGNTVNGSVHEHILRTSGATELNITDNNFSNYDGKGCIEIHVGGYAWIQDNTATDGDIRVGPLGLWGEPIDTTVDCVINGNRVTGSDIQVYAGAQNIQIENNIITRNGQQLLDVIGQDGQGRQSSNINILNNTGIDTGSTGNFLKLENHTVGVTLDNNLFIATSMIVGAYNTAPVYVAESNLSSFTSITGNVWQQPQFYPTAQGGVNVIGGSYQSSSKWNSYANVGTDYFASTPITSADAAQPESLASYVDSPAVGVFNDIYGNVRPSTGSWSAGAV